MDIYKTWKWK